MTVPSRTSKREQRRSRFEAAFGSAADAAFDLLELMEFAWHDCYGEVSPPDQVVEDMLVVSGGRLDLFASAARLAVEDFRDLRLNADAIRK